MRPDTDEEFRKLVTKWYDMRRSGEIKSANFQLYPPRNEDHNVIRNSLGSLEYPLFFHAERHGKKYHIILLDEDARWQGRCVAVE